MKTDQDSVIVGGEPLTLGSAAFTCADCGKMCWLADPELQQAAAGGVPVLCTDCGYRHLAWNPEAEPTMTEGTIRQVQELTGRTVSRQNMLQLLAQAQDEARRRFGRKP